MNTIDVLNASGLCCNIFGSILLAVSLSKYLTSMHGALAIHDMQIQSLVRRDNKILNADIAKILMKGVNNGRIRTTIGLILIVIGFVLQAIPFVLSIFFGK